MLSAQGMSTRAIAPVVGVRSDQTIRADLAKVRDDHAPELLDMLIGPESVSDPTPAKIIGRDGKTYTRPEPKETSKETTMTAASRLAIPQPPKYGGNRPKHNQVIGNVIVSAQGLCIVADEIKTLDGSINSEEAASYADDLSRIIRSLKRIQQLLTKEV